MVRRHSNPGKFQVYDTSSMNTHRDSVARILPKPLKVLNTVKNTSAKIHFKYLNLKNVMLREALAAQMMPPPPPPGPPTPMGGPEGQVGPIKYVVNNNTNDLILQEGEVEFYKNDMETGSVGSGGSASEDFDHEEHMNIIAALGKFLFSLFGYHGVLKFSQKVSFFIFIVFCEKVQVNFDSKSQQFRSGLVRSVSLGYF